MQAHASSITFEVLSPAAKLVETSTETRIHAATNQTLEAMLPSETLRAEGILPALARDEDLDLLDTWFDQDLCSHQAITLFVRHFLQSWQYCNALRAQAVC